MNFEASLSNTLVADVSFQNTNYLTLSEGIKGSTEVYITAFDALGASNETQFTITRRPMVMYFI